MQRATAFFINEDGLPVLCKLYIRESTTAPNRLKLAFGATFEKGTKLFVPEQADAEEMPDELAGESMFGPEFRLEMN